MVSMAKPDFSQFFFLIFSLVPQRDPYLKKTYLGGTKVNFWKKNFFWKNLVWPFWPVRNANRKNGLAFYSTPWEPKKRLMAASISEKVVTLYEFYLWFLIVYYFFHLQVRQSLLNRKGKKAKASFNQESHATKSRQRSFTIYW